VEFVFSDHVLDVDRRELRRRGELIALEPQVFDLLVYLVRNRDRVVSKDDLLEAIWDGRIVSESTMTSRINAARKAVGDSGEAQRLIRTIPRKGIRFVGAMRDEQKPAARVDADPQKLSAAPSTELKSARRLSMVVLPFNNLSDDREQQYFADAITDDLTTDLSRISGSFVISRNTAFTYKDKPVSAKQIGRELGVRYVLEGSVRRSGKLVRVNAQLIDAETDAHLWADRFEGATRDLFALQDEITRRIAVTLHLELVDAEAARPTEHPDALDCIFRGRAAVSNPKSRGVYAEAISLFERALALDPRSVAAHSWLALTLANRVMNQMTDTAAADVQRAEGLVGQGLAVSPRSPLAHYGKGQVLRAQRRYAEAIPEYEVAVASNRNWVTAIAHLGECKFRAGSTGEAIPAQEQAIRLSPRDPEIGVWYYRIGQAHLLHSRTDEAILWLEKARSANPAVPLPHAFLASAYALKGERERAAAELAEARRLSGDDRYSSIACVKATGFLASERPKVRALFETTYFAGLSKAGMP
jgi:TolB-like protein